MKTERYSVSGIHYVVVDVVVVDVIVAAPEGVIQFSRGYGHRRSTANAAAADGRRRLVPRALRRVGGEGDAGRSRRRGDRRHAGIRLGDVVADRLGRNVGRFDIGSLRLLESEIPR